MSLHILRRNRKRRQDLGEFDALVLSPVAGPFSMPANGLLAIISTIGNAGGATGASVVGPSSYNITMPALAAGQFVTLTAEKDAQITRSANFKIAVIDAYGRRHLLTT